MRKACGIVCLALWVIMLIYAVISVVLGVRVHPLSFLCSVAICVVHYLGEVFNKK